MSADKLQLSGLMNRRLRRWLHATHEEADELFRALCTDDEVRAEAAMGELWGSGDFDCGPQDYAFIVERCLEALSVTRTQPIA
jgi:hypothetical protein